MARAVEVLVEQDEHEDMEAAFEEQGWVLMSDRATGLAWLERAEFDEPDEDGLIQWYMIEAVH